MSYKRVIPRDFYNEAKLLNNMGRLALLINDEILPKGVRIKIQESGEPFDIERDDLENCLYMVNYSVYINGKRVPMRTNVNSRCNYPLTATIEEEEIYVFDDNGQFSDDFIQAATQIK